jgi:hypothetical protein
MNTETGNTNEKRDDRTKIKTVLFVVIATVAIVLSIEWLFFANMQRDCQDHWNEPCSIIAVPNSISTEFP